MAILSKNTVDELFRREAVLLGSADGVPEYRASFLFGEAAVDFARRAGNVNGYGIGDFTLMYLSYKGFLDAASFYNVQQLRDAEEKPPRMLEHPKRQSGKS